MCINILLRVPSEPNLMSLSTRLVCVEMVTVSALLRAVVHGADSAYVVPLSEGQNIQLLEQIVSDQRGILMNTFNTSDVTTIPQVWTLCAYHFSFLLQVLADRHSGQIKKFLGSTSTDCKFRRILLLCGLTTSMF